MEEDEYKAAYNEIAVIRCEFEKTLTNNLGQCSLSKHFLLAGREGYACKSDKSAAICSEYLEKLRAHSRFLLKLQRAGEPLPHNMEIRVQSGGLQGLMKLLNPRLDDLIAGDIVDIVSQAVSLYGSLEELPYSDIVQSVAGTKVRKRSKSKQ